MMRHHTRHRSRGLMLAVGGAALIVCAAGAARAQVQGPTIEARGGAERTRAIRRSRAQGYSPVERAQIVRQLSAMNPSSSEFRSAISTAPLQVRAEVFLSRAAEPQSFARRLRGMLKAGKTNRVSKPSKTVFEVNSANLDLFKQVMGQNVVWFAVTPPPGHLHTLITDQGGGDGFHHNTYGTSTNAGSISGNQYALPVVLTDHEMDRFTRYLNAGMANGSNKTSVFGFFRKAQQDGRTVIQVERDMACTNWATSAPIGELPRWATTLEKRLGRANVPELSGGLHAQLAAAADAPARQAIVQRVLAHEGLSKWTRSAVKRMGKSFEKELAAWPNRPRDLVLRSSLAETLGLSRSRDPAKWAYDLLMNKRVPVVAVTSTSRLQDFANMTFDMEVMGKVGPTGVVEANGTTYNGAVNDRGVIPPERLAGAAARPQQP